MSFFGWLFGEKKSKDKSIDAVFERINKFLNDDKLQNDFIPESIRKLMIKGGSVDTIQGASGEFGRSISNPIPVNGPLGEITYLSRLLTDSGKRMFFHRLGSIAPSGLGAGLFDENNVDVYELLAEDGSLWDCLYLDMYHVRKSKKAPSGYIMQQETLLLRGTNAYFKDFPKDFRQFLNNNTVRSFGCPISDPDAKLISGFTRPVEQEEKRSYCRATIDTSQIIAAINQALNQNAARNNTELVDKLLGHKKRSIYS